MTRFLLAALVALAASPAHAQSVRAPYLQSPTETSIVIAWRTAAAQPSRVCWGTAPGALTNTAGSGTSEARHAVTISGLSPDTQYHYAVGATSCPPAAAGDARDTFRTAPPRGSSAPFRMWIVGDSGTGGTRQGQVRDAMIAATTDRRPDLFLHMGDMAYDAGREAEFDDNFFDMYASVMRNVPCWPTMGNHEGSSADSATQTGPYYDAYFLPTDGRAGGLASGTEAYYAFDWGNAHFVVLDSHDTSRSPTGAMLTWLDDDLAATTATWIVVYFHHPPYTDGSHDSDSEGQLIDMRENALPIMEAHGVDLVLAGHSHIYERSWLMRGAYDTPTTAGGHVVDMGDGRLDGSGAYRSGADGTVYVVAGHGGTGVSGSGNHPVMYLSEVANGSCIVDVDGEELTLRNLRWDGVETDHFTLLKRDGLFLATPNGGETYLAGSTVRIAWSSVGTTTGVRIESSIDGGATWAPVIDRTENDGMHDWVTPGVETTRARIRISDADDATNTDESGDFALSTESRSTVIPFGGPWQYSDDGTDRGDAWRMGEGGAWTEGRAELGYGDGDEMTLLRDEDPNIPTVYFRQRFVVDGEVTFARLRAVYDDGIAVWINGQLVTQRNVDDGLGFATYASADSADNETLDETLDLSASNPFVEGENWVAAIVKQTSASSSDVSFDLDLELGVRTTIVPGVDAGVPPGVDGGPLPPGVDGGPLPPGVDGGTGGEEGAGCGCRTGTRASSRAMIAMMIAIAGAISIRRRR